MAKVSALRWILLAVLTPSCAHSALPASPSVGASAKQTVLQTVAGHWIGQTQCLSNNHVGTLDVTLIADPQDGTVDGELVWSDSNGSHTYHADVDGDLPLVVIEATDYVNCPTCLPGCVYVAKGELAEDGTHISGTYQADHGGCRADAGVFRINRQ